MNDNDNAGFSEEIVEPDAEGSGVNLEDFIAYPPTHVYVFKPCREVWIATGVDACVPPVPVLTKAGKPKRDKNGKPIVIRATRWLDQNQRVECMTWCPGQPMLIPDRLVVHGGWIERRGVTTFNLYRPPRLKLGDATKTQSWLDHVHKVFEQVDAEHIIKWLAHRVQHPGEKINHALVLGGDQGIGKDSMLEPVKRAVGPWNFHEVSPTHLLGRFNNFVKSVILRVNEGRDLGEVDRFKFYDHMKIYTAAPPDVLRVDEKHLREHYVFNVLGFTPKSGHWLSVLGCCFVPKADIVRDHRNERPSNAWPSEIPKRETGSEHQSDQQVPIAPDPCSNNASQITEVQKAYIGFGRFEVKLDFFGYRNELLLERRGECALIEIGEPKSDCRSDQGHNRA
jgi:hypothetical protein